MRQPPASQAARTSVHEAVQDCELLLMVGVDYPYSNFQGYAWTLAVQSCELIKAWHRITDEVH
jgi:hypothetical protein